MKGGLGSGHREGLVRGGLAMSAQSPSSSSTLLSSSAPQLGILAASYSPERQHWIEVPPNSMSSACPGFTEL